MADIYMAILCGQFCMAILYGGFVWRLLVPVFSGGFDEEFWMADLCSGFVWRFLVAVSSE